MNATDTSKARAMQRLAASYPPAWSPPPEMRYHLTDADLVRLFNLVPGGEPDPLVLLSRERERASHRIESIEDLSHYARPGFLAGQWWTDGPDGIPRAGSTYSRSGHDRSVAYWWLWYIDVLIKVYTP